MDVFQHIAALRKGQLAKASTPTLPDWRSLVKEHGPAGQHHLVLAKGIVDDVDPLELASQLVFWNGPLFVDVPDEPEFREALSKVGDPFVFDDESVWGRLFLSDKPIEGAIPIEKKQWTRKYINALPDSAFLHVEAGGEKDSEGKTVPRSLRHFPVYDANGKLDPPHVKNALSRIPKSKLPDSVKAEIKAKAEKLLASIQKAAVESVIKPFAGFENFDACVVGMKGKGYSEDVAKKICGKLQAQTEKTLKSFRNVALLNKSENDVPAEERVVFGIVLQPETVDSQGDIYSADEIKKACYLFMEQFGHFKIQHKGEFVDGALVTLENYILKEDWKTTNAFGQEKIVKAGTWLHGARVNSDDLWNEIKEGKFTGWSIGGWSRQEPVE